MKKSGFTLIEVLIVIVVIAILAAIILPRILWGPKERENTLKANLAEIRAAVDLYQKQHGAYPTSLDVLTREKNDTTSKPYMDELPRPYHRQDRLQLRLDDRQGPLQGPYRHNHHRRRLQGPMSYKNAASRHLHTTRRREDHIPTGFPLRFF